MSQLDRAPLWAAACVREWLTPIAEYIPAAGAARDQNPSGRGALDVEIGHFDGADKSRRRPWL